MFLIFNYQKHQITLLLQTLLFKVTKTAELISLIEKKIAVI